MLGHGLFPLRQEYSGCAVLPHVGPMALQATEDFADQASQVELRASSFELSISCICF
jgi:hypothetical protein